MKLEGGCNENSRDYFASIVLDIFEAPERNSSILDQLVYSRHLFRNSVNEILHSFAHLAICFWTPAFHHICIETSSAAQLEKTTALAWLVNEHFLELQWVCAAYVSQVIILHSPHGRAGNYLTISLYCVVYPSTATT